MHCLQCLQHGIRGQDGEAQCERLAHQYWMDWWCFRCGPPNELEGLHTVAKLWKEYIHWGEITPHAKFDGMSLLFVETCSSTWRYNMFQPGFHSVMCRLLGHPCNHWCDSLWRFGKGRVWELPQALMLKGGAFQASHISQRFITLPYLA